MAVNHITWHHSQIEPARLGIDGALRVVMILGCCGVDFSINAYRIDSIGLDGLLWFAFYAMAAILAVSPSLLTLFGDEKSEQMGWLACAGTLIFSCWSIFGFTAAKADLPRVSQVQIQAIESQALDLEDWYTTQKALCRTRSIDQCDSAKLHDSYLEKRSELRAQATAINSRPASPSTTQNVVDMILMVSLSCLLQLVSREFARHLASSWRSCRESKELREHQLNLAQQARLLELEKAKLRIEEFRNAKKTPPKAA